MYILRNFRRIRRRTDYIIITHARNLMEKFYIDPFVIQGNNGFTWGTWQNYFIDDLKKDALPCHYFVEYMERDYVIYKGLADFQPSYFVEDLVSASIIDYKYMNSIVVVISEDFSINTLEDRLCQQLADKVLSPLLRQHELDFTRIKYIDECLKDNWEENLKFSNLNYKYTKQRYFNFQKIKTNIDKYKKK
ncbi:hypothetical protein Bp8pS_050 [Bacillus phage vB_BpuM-BpSp]|nr:hypothetical protein Bp8pS_050 [Bacillus phage vB_BpuM-BpSp]